MTSGTGASTDDRGTFSRDVRSRAYNSDDRRTNSDTPVIAVKRQWDSSYCLLLPRPCRTVGAVPLPLGGETEVREGDRGGQCTGTFNHAGQPGGVGLRRPTPPMFSVEQALIASAPHSVPCLLHPQADAFSPRSALTPNAIIISIEPVRIGTGDAEAPLGYLPTVQIGRIGRDTGVWVVRVTLGTLRPGLWLWLRRR
jgi:hypothetical protein